MSKIDATAKPEALPKLSLRRETIRGLTVRTTLKTGPHIEPIHHPPCFNAASVAPPG